MRILLVIQEKYENDRGSVKQAVVKTPQIEINIKGVIPDKLMSVLKEEYGEQIQLYGNADEERVNVFETDWYRSVKSGMTPGVNLRIYRENHGLTQARLGEILGGVPRQHYLEYGERSPVVQPENGAQTGRDIPSVP